jgi:peroxiredoxin Q/BCP
MKSLFLTVLTIATLTFNVLADPIAVGAIAPRVAGTDQDGKEVKLEALYKRGIVLVFFYPKANTGGCTKEVCGIRDNFDELKKTGLQIVGVSMDKVEAQKSFVDKQNLKFSLLADPEGLIVKAFGVPEIKPGLAKRQSFLVLDGRVVWRDLDVNPETHADAVKAAVAKAVK